MAPLVYRKSGILTISESSKWQLVRHGFDPNRVSVVHPAIDSPLWANYNAAQKRFTKSIVYMGRLKRYKGVLTLVRAFSNVVREHPEATLQIVGKGDLLPEVQSRVKELNLTDNVIIRGYLSENEKAKVLFESGVVVYPAEYFDGGWSIACAEAMALGAVPVVSSNLMDMVAESGAGIIYKTGDHVALGHCMNRLLSDTELWSSMSTKASAWAREFTWEKVADQILIEMIRFIRLTHSSKGAS